MKKNNLATRISIKHILFFIFSLFIIVACEKQEKTQERRNIKITCKTDTALRSNLMAFSRSPRVRGDFSFYVFDLTANHAIIDYNGTMPMPAASCMKLLSGVAAIDLLGTRYMYVTELLTKGVINNGVLCGDLIFKGSLDPLFMPSDMIHFARVLKQSGIKKIMGRAIIDLVIKAPVRSEKHWYPWDLSFSKYGIFYKGKDRILKRWKEALRKEGIDIKDNAFVLDKTPQKAVARYRYYRPINMVIKRMWKNSSNTQSTALLYTIGHYVNKHVDLPISGVKYIRLFAKKVLGKDAKAIIIHDACGLCTHNRLTTKALTSILVYGYKNKDIYNMLMQNLSIAGVDGTLAKEMKSEKTRGKIFAKTGTLSHPYGISSLAGYCTASNGHCLAFAIINNQMSVLDARVMQKKICEILIK